MLTVEPTTEDKLGDIMYYEGLQELGAFWCYMVGYLSHDTEFKNGVLLPADVIQDKILEIYGYWKDSHVG